MQARQRGTQRLQPHSAESGSGSGSCGRRRAAARGAQRPSPEPRLEAAHLSSRPAQQAPTSCMGFTSSRSSAFGAMTVLVAAERLLFSTPTSAEQPSKPAQAARGDDGRHTTSTEPCLRTRSCSVASLLGSCALSKIAKHACLLLRPSPNPPPLTLWQHHDSLALGLAAAHQHGAQAAGQGARVRQHATRALVVRPDDLLARARDEARGLVGKHRDGKACGGSAGEGQDVLAHASCSPTRAQPSTRSPTPGVLRIARQAASHGRRERAAAVGCAAAEHAAPLVRKGPDAIITASL